MVYSLQRYAGLEKERKIIEEIGIKDG